jgi:hypothetical protein
VIHTASSIQLFDIIGHWQFIGSQVGVWCLVYAAAADLATGKTDNSALAAAPDSRSCSKCMCICYVLHGWRHHVPRAAPTPTAHIPHAVRRLLIRRARSLKNTTTPWHCNGTWYMAPAAQPHQAPTCSRWNWADLRPPNCTPCTGNKPPIEVLVPDTSRDGRAGRAPMTPRRAPGAPKCARRPCND